MTCLDAFFYRFGLLILICAPLAVLVVYHYGR